MSGDELIKDSGLKWYGKIPSHWKSHIKLQTLALDRRGSFTNGPFGSDLLTTEITDSGVPIIYIRDIAKGFYNRVSDAFVPVQKAKQLNVCNVEPGDLLVAKVGDPPGISAVYPFDEPKAIITQDVIRIKLNQKKTDSRFLSFLINSSFGQAIIEHVTVESTRSRISLSDFKRIVLFLPPLHEQTTLANYLITKSQAIDKKISLIESKISYFHELRKSLINETVTKGLDKNAELHTSELGFVTPKKWLRYRLKDVGSLYSGLSGKSGDDFNQDDNPNNKGFIPFTNIANNTYLKRDHLGSVVVYEGEKQNQVRQGDIFFLMSSEGYEDIGKSAALAEDIEETYLNSFCKGYRVNTRKTNPYFLNYLMLSDYYRQLLIVEGKGFTRINLKMEKVNDFLVYIPDTLSTQEEIVKFLDAKLDTIAKIIANIQIQITTLKELRKTLINNVVTGNIKK